MEETYEKIFKLANVINQQLIGVIRDYNRKYISAEFTNGCIINNNIILDYMSQIWGIDFSGYQVDQYFKDGD